MKKQRTGGTKPVAGTSRSAVKKADRITVPNWKTHRYSTDQRVQTTATATTLESVPQISSIVGVIVRVWDKLPYYSVSFPNVQYPLVLHENELRPVKEKIK